MGNLGLHLEEDIYWIDGYFARWWTNYVWFCPDRDLYVPKSQTVRLERHRIYINPSFARGQIALRNTKVLRSGDKNDMHLIAFCKALNTPWVKEEYEEPEPQFRVSLP